jgi:hypothetical protein
MKRKLKSVDLGQIGVVCGRKRRMLSLRLKLELAESDENVSDENVSGEEEVNFVGDENDVV